jgi:hypothetical protein
VKQSDLGEYKENAREKQNIQYKRQKYQLPLKPSHKDGKHQSPPPQISKSRRIKGFGENIGQLSLGVYSTEMALVLSHMRGTLSKLTPKSLMVCTIQIICEQQLAVATYSTSVVDCATENRFQEDQQMREDPRK